jgi:hypothetical protein
MLTCIVTNDMKVCIKCTSACYGAYQV